MRIGGNRGFCRRRDLAWLVDRGGVGELSCGLVYCVLLLAF